MIFSLAAIGLFTFNYYNRRGHFVPPTVALILAVAVIFLLLASWFFPPLPFPIKKYRNLFGERTTQK